MTPAIALRGHNNHLRWPLQPNVADQTVEHRLNSIAGEAEDLTNNDVLGDLADEFLGKLHAQLEDRRCSCRAKPWGNHPGNLIFLGNASTS